MFPSIWVCMGALARDGLILTSEVLEAATGGLL